MNSIYIRRERVPQKLTKAQKGVRGGGAGGVCKHDEFRAYEWPTSKTSWFDLLPWKPFQNDVSYFIWKAVFFLKIFAIFSRVFENVESWLVYAETLFWIFQPYFSSDIINKVVSASFSCFSRLLMKKIKFLINCYCFNRSNLSIF